MVSTNKMFKLSYIYIYIYTAWPKLKGGYVGLRFTQKFNFNRSDILTQYLYGYSFEESEVSNHKIQKFINELNFSFFGFFEVFSWLNSILSFKKPPYNRTSNNKWQSEFSLKLNQV